MDDSLNTIIDCNRALKYIFIFEYFLKDEDADIEDLIDNNLDTLQKQVDSLLELVELDQLPNILKISDKDNFKKKFLEYKDHIISLMNSTENFKKKSVDEIQNNLLDNIDGGANRLVDVLTNKVDRNRAKLLKFHQEQFCLHLWQLHALNGQCIPKVLSYQEYRYHPGQLIRQFFCRILDAQLRVSFLYKLVLY